MQELVQLTWVLAEAFRCHVHHFQCCSTGIVMHWKWCTWHRKASAKNPSKLNKFLHSEVNLLIQHITVQDQDGQNKNIIIWYIQEMCRMLVDNPFHLSFLISPRRAERSTDVIWKKGTPFEAMTVRIAIIKQSPSWTGMVTYEEWMKKWDLERFWIVVRLEEEEEEEREDPKFVDEEVTTGMKQKGINYMKKNDMEEWRTKVK